MANETNPSQKVLMKWDSNWADEMDIEGFVICTQAEAEEWKANLKKRGGFTIYVGTNEEIEYDNGKQLIKEVTIQSLTEEEAITIEKFFGDTGGHYNFFDYGFGEDEDEDY